MIYYVEWRIDIEADSLHEAAKKALAIQRDPNSIATLFAICKQGTYEFIDVDAADDNGGDDD